MNPVFAAQFMSDHGARVEQALGAKRWFASIPDDLAAAYFEEQYRDHQKYNRRVIIIFSAVFLLFVIPVFQQSLNIALILLASRIFIMYPLVAVFLFMDRAGRLRGFYQPFLLLLAVLPALISDLPGLFVPEPLDMPGLAAEPLILLATGMIWRMAPLTTVANALISSGVFIGSLLIKATVPPTDLISLVLTELAVAVAVVTFGLQLERRDRRVFLLTMRERLRADALAAINRGLLLESQTDALTNVANRRCFDDRMATAWLACLKEQVPISAILLDIDHFKAFNDCYGHPKGDACLRYVAVQARGHIRRGDLFARYGGEEFAAILPNATREEACVIAERMREAVLAMRLPHEGVGPNAVVTISLGVASVLPREPDEAQHLIDLADAFLYSAKRNGRNRVEAARSEPLPAQLPS